MLSVPAPLMCTLRPRAHLTLTRASKLPLHASPGFQHLECHPSSVSEYLRVSGQCRRREAEMTAAPAGKTPPTVNITQSHIHVITHGRRALSRQEI